MKRYLAFAYRKYYPGGGKDDCIGVFDRPSEAMEIAASDIHSWSDTAFLDILDTAKGSWECHRWNDAARDWELLLTDTVERQATEARQEHEERTARDEDDFDDDDDGVAEYVPAAHTDPNEAMLASGGPWRPATSSCPRRRP